MSNWSYVVAAYGLTYLVLAGYALSLVRRRRRIERPWSERES